MVSADQRIPIVEAVGLRKTFKDFWLRTRARAVDGVDFQIFPNEIFGLLGPNGSGKSTIIKMILGLLHTSGGRLTVFGKSPTEVDIKKQIGFLPEESYLYRYLNPRETLEFYGKLFGIGLRTRRRRIDELLDMVGLSQVAHRPIGEFSKGMTRRIGLAQALINDPDFLILDEPTSGLDPIGTRQVKDLLLELRRRGKTILLSSHLLADVEDVCDRMVVLYGGRIRAEGTARDLLSDEEHTLIQTARLRPETIERIERVVQECEGTGIEKVEAPRQRLEQLFLTIVEQAREEQAETSGALQGGGTAAFLRGAPAEGESLIESLVSGEEEGPRARAVEAPAAAPAPQAKEDVVSALVRDEPSATQARPRPRDAQPPRAPEQVDRSVIDSLLSDEDAPPASP
jgi:ABC-2 type transport system ATP-binding protein